MASYAVRERSRIAGKTIGDRGKWLSNFVTHRLEMLLSPAWQAVPRPLARVIERLEIEHLRHGGAENGNLFVSYEQFVAYGVSRKSIRPTLEVGVALGLIEISQIQEIRGDIRPPNAYRLTFLPAKGRKDPSDEWKAIDAERAERALAIFRQKDENPRFSKREAAA